jgi:outer membrane protein assembly factor BamB
MNDPATGACRWGHSFGPGGGSLENQLLSGIATPDLNGDGWPDAVVGVRNGWVCAFDGPTGKPLWSRALPSPVTMVVGTSGEGVEEGAAVIAGCEDGRVYRLNRDGQPTHGAVVEGAPTVGVWLGGPEPLCLVGTQSGSLVALSARGA